MMALESIEQLREQVRRVANNSLIAEITVDVMESWCDDIQAEVESKYMPIPVDADGVPIRIGDELYLNVLTHGKVSALMLTPDGWEWNLEGDGWYDVGFTYHIKPDPVKELLEELIGRAYTIEKVDSAPHPVVDERDIDEIAARIWDVVQPPADAKTESYTTMGKTPPSNRL